MSKPLIIAESSPLFNDISTPKSSSRFTKKNVAIGAVSFVALLAITFITLSLVHHYTGYQFGKLGTALTASNKWFIGAAHTIKQGVVHNKTVQAYLIGAGGTLVILGIGGLSFLTYKNIKRQQRRAGFERV